ncbi:nucleoside hydrolase [Candidatus Woesearchaeota archaeon]|nr:nucleoside hydrolase [Candidatus Woesearchaeota archaeon]
MGIRKKVIIDTDPGVDDALAIAYALKSQLLEVVALTTVFGNSQVDQTTRNALSLIKFLNADIPVYKGSGNRIDGSNPSVLASSQAGTVSYFNSRPESSMGEMNAIDAIICCLETARDSISIIAIGPLTNIAKSYQKSPESFKDKLERIWIMGGAINTYGNISPVAEFNFYSDPMAADIVLKADIPKTLVPVNACRKVVMTPEELKSLSGNSLIEDLDGLVGEYMRYYVNQERLGGAVMYDPAVVGLCANPAFIRKQIPLYVRVETAGELSLGQSVADLRPNSQNKPNVSVCLDLESAPLKSEFYQALSRQNQPNWSK